MLSKDFCFFLWIFVVLVPSSECDWVSFLKLPRQLKEELSNEGDNETDVQEFLDENNTTTIESTMDIFWTTSDLNLTTESTEFLGEENVTENTLNEVFDNTTISEKNDSNLTELISPIEADEESVNSEVKNPDNEFGVPQMDEEIVLPRSNCNMEIGIDENQDTRILIKFEPVENRKSGKCCIALNGERNSVLGVLISGVHLLERSAEKLTVVTNNFGTDFVLKEYYDKTEYQPLLLTESHKVYIILHYNVSEQFQNEYSRFNLEVFSYRKQVKQKENFQSSYSSANTNLNIDNMYLTTDEPLFADEQYYYSDFY